VEMTVFWYDTIWHFNKTILCQRTVNRKGMGANIRAYGGRILLVSVPFFY